MPGGGGGGGGGHGDDNDDDVTAHRYVRFKVFTAVTMKNAVFWDVTSYGSYKNRIFRRM
jgi:hypothetical protein